eukprot:TRINITY_DN19623_c0_g1_i1.p1 TRINITY_DN19623_c0_g1~~TRINITY_DN19623_c0_g1_i1.p1  ORF type:complete len:735 (-),score=111.36 TRINITY_DN19623_c0_g1_i1:65-2011(-)
MTDKSTDRGTFNSMNSDIVITDKPVTLYGEMPYTEQARKCQVEGDRINFPQSFFSDINETTDKVGSIGTMVLKQWMSYRYGIFEEVGFPMDKTYPSVYCNDTTREISSCSNVELKRDNGFVSIRNDADDCKCEKDGPLPYCMFALEHDEQDPFLLSSIMGFSQIPTNTGFCDSDYFHHDEEKPTIHNEICEKEPTFDVVLKHNDFDGGHNPPDFITETNPTITEMQQALRIRIVLDTKQNRAFGSHVTTLVRDWVLREKKKGVDFGSNLIATGGKYWNIEKFEIGNIEDITNIVYTPSTYGNYSNLEAAMEEAIKDIDSTSSKSFPSYIILISDGSETKGNMTNAFTGIHYVNVVAIDTSDNGAKSMEDISKATNNGFYAHAAENPLEVSNALNAFSSTFSYNDDADMAMLYSNNTITGTSASFSVPVDSSLGTIQLALYFKSFTPADVSITLERNGKMSRSSVSTTSSVPTTILNYDINDDIGEWVFSIESESESSFTVAAQILGGKKLEKDGIKLECELRKTLVRGNNDGTRVIARALQGNMPIVKANVVAFVGNSTIMLKDDGQLNDSIADDGVYTELLPEGFSGSVQCQIVTKTGQGAYLHPGFDQYVLAHKLRQPFCCGSRAPIEESRKAENIQRISQSAFYS